MFSSKCSSKSRVIFDSLGLSRPFWDYHFFQQIYELLGFVSLRVPLA